MAKYLFPKGSLKIALAWDFGTKVQKSLAKIIEFHNHHEGNVAISFSGGLDSTVLLHLARSTFPDIRAVFLDTGIENKEVVIHVRSCENIEIITPRYCELGRKKKPCVNCRLGCFGTIVSKHGVCYPNKDLAYFLQARSRNVDWASQAKHFNKERTAWIKDNTQALERLPSIGKHISDKCCYYLKERPLDVWHRENNVFPIIGTRASESLRRTIAWMRVGCNNFYGKRSQSTPLAFWSTNDVLHYLKRFDVPYPSIYGEIVEAKNGKLKNTGVERTGCAICLVQCGKVIGGVTKFERLKQNEPELWDYGINTCGLGEFMDCFDIRYGKDG